MQTLQEIHNKAKESSLFFARIVRSRLGIY